MKLAELEAEFLRYEERDGSRYHVPVESIEQAQGVMFLCPKCFATNSGPVGTHRVICWSRSRGVPESAVPGPGRWSLHGTGIDDLTLNGDPLPPEENGARSVLLTGDGCGWHGFVTNGSAE